jgi:predicted DNA-binding protein YlxM (UPF0122 family)
MKKILNDTEQQLIVFEYLNNHNASIRSIAKKYNCSTHPINLAIKNNSRNYTEQKKVNDIFGNIKVSAGLCLEWQGQKNSQGYGYVGYSGKTRRVNRLVYELVFGEIPDGMFVCHTCDNPSCINPQHLFLGTPADNIQDMYNKNRQNDNKNMPSGERHHNSKLKNSDIPKIRRLLKSGRTQQNIADVFSVSQTTIYEIAAGRTWKNA